MYIIFKTIEFLGHQITKKLIVSIKLLSFYNKVTKKKMILVMGVTARKSSESECFSEKCEILVKICITY